jgi:hypothetical protein
MSVQIGFQLGVVLHVVVILDDGRVSRQFALDVGMVMKKPSEVRHVIMHWVTIPIVHVRIAVEGILLPHEGVRVLS